MQPYEPRAIRFHGLREVDGWRLKVYSVAYGSNPIDWPAFEPALKMADRDLPRPAVTSSRRGVGFVIAHRGLTALYCILAWWDNENELPLRVFVRGLDAGSDWRNARGVESICVWDLQVIGFERDAYVATVLADTDVGGADEAYLSVVLAHEPRDVGRVTAPYGAR